MMQEEVRDSMDSPGSGTSFESDYEIEEPARWFGGWLPFQWCPTSMSLLRAAEKRILSYVKREWRGRYVNIGPVLDNSNEECKIWTISMNESSRETPLVLLHGLGAGVALWALNLDGLSASRPLYAFDLLGFGRSSRPYFSSDAMEAETQLVNSIERWREEMRLEKFSLLGHSMGGFLATSYAIRFPERISHLILADPWGFPERPSDTTTMKYPIPIWVKMIAYLLKPLNPLWGIRVAGPMGPKLIEKVRPDLIKKFSSLTEEEGSGADVANYIFHCNAQSPTGESAFHAMMSSFGWAKFPMCNRIVDLKEEVPLTMIYGSRSWVDHCPGEIIKKMRQDSYVDVQIIHGAGHHVYADKREQFNGIVLKSCEIEPSTSLKSENNRRLSISSINSSSSSSAGEEEPSTYFENVENETMAKSVPFKESNVGNSLNINTESSSSKK